MNELARSHLWQLVLINLVWGFNIVAIKLSVDRFPPVFLSFLRFLVVGLLVWPWLRLRRGEMRWLFTAAICSGGLQFALMFTGVTLSGNMSSVAIASQLGVPFATLLSIALLGERVRWRRWSGIGLAFLGVCIMGFDPAVFSQRMSLAFVIGSAFIGSLGLIAIKRLPPMRPLELQAWIAWISWPLLLALSLLVEGGQRAGLASAGWAGWGALAYTAIFSSLFAHTAYFFLVQRYPVTSIAPLTVLSPVFSVIFGVLLLGDALTPRIALGGACTLLGVLIITLREKQFTDTGS